MATTTNIATMAAINKSINNSINLIDEITTTIKDWERKFTQFCLDHKQAEQRYADLDPLPPTASDPLATDPIQPEINGDTINPDIQPRLDHKDAAIVNAKGNFTTNTSSSLRLLTANSNDNLAAKNIRA
jgi:hypothetical protein